MNECKDYEMFKLNVNVCLEFNICCEIEAFTRRKYQKVNVSEIRFWYKIKNVLMRTNKKSNKVTIENMWYTILSFENFAFERNKFKKYTI